MGPWAQSVLSRSWSDNYNKTLIITETIVFKLNTQQMEIF